MTFLNVNSLGCLKAVLTIVLSVFLINGIILNGDITDIISQSPMLQASNWSEFKGDDGKNRKCENLLSTEVGGRLGNRMGEYSTLFNIAKKLKVQPAIPKILKEMLGETFPNLSIPVREDFGCNESSKFTVVTRAEVFKIKNVSKLFEKYNTTLISLEKYGNHLFEDNKGAIRKEFEFNSNLKMKSAKFLRDVKKIHFNRLKIQAKNRINTIFIGVHVRRTDYLKLLKRKFGKDKSLVSSKYFLTAMDTYRKQFHSSKKVKGRVKLDSGFYKQHVLNTLIFIVSSDDLKWCKKNFKGLSDVYFASYGNSPEQDMSILSQCNHTITDYGTYGFWSAVLSGGDEIALY